MLLLLLLLHSTGPRVCSTRLCCQSRRDGTRERAREGNAECNLQEGGRNLGTVECNSVRFVWMIGTEGSV